MAEYTKEKPFMFEGVPYARSGHAGAIITNRGYGEWVPARRAEAIHAFIEAERNEWRWTNDEHTEARRGRWTLVDGTPEGFKGSWGISHDDLRHEDDGVWCNFICHHDTGLAREGLPPALHGVIQELMDDFLAWKSAQEQPEEPTGLGAVVEVEDELGLVRYVRASGDMPWISEDTLSEARWEMLTKGAANVTILSPGVDA